MSNKFFAMAILPLALFVRAETSSTSLGEMTITASRFEESISTVLAPISILTKEEIKALGANSLTDALKTLPGIEISQSGGRGQLASIFLRGSESNHTLVLIDGVRLPASMFGTPDFNMIPLNSIERIEVIRGPSSSSYGPNAMTGVISIITRHASLDKGAKVKINIGKNGLREQYIRIGESGNDFDYKIFGQILSINFLRECLKMLFQIE